MENGAKDLRDVIMLAVPFFAFVGAGLVIDTLRPTEKPSRPPVNPPPGERPFLNGSFTAGFGEDRELHSRMSYVLLPYWNEVLYWGAREVSDKVVPGRGNWLFWNGANFWPEVPDETRPEFVKHFRFAGQVRRLIEEKGVGFIMILTPDKARIYPEMGFKDGKMPPDIEDLYRWYVQGLREQGIATIDIESRLLELRRTDPELMLYGPTDTHWHDPAVKLIAAEIAQMAYDGGWLSREDADPRFGEKYHEESWTDDETIGNLARMTNVIPDGPAWNRFKYQRPRRRLIETATGERVRNMTPSEVLVLGTSFTAEESFDFPQSLAMELGRPVEFRWRPGQMAFHMLTEFMKEEENIATRRLVIWEISLGI